MEAVCPEEPTPVGSASSAKFDDSKQKGGMARLAPHLKAVALGARTLDAVAPGLATRIMLRHFTRPRRRPGANYRRDLPPGARQLSLDHDGVELVGWRWGSSGPSVLLAHGWEDHTGAMLPFVEPMLALGFQVYALDAPGHGLSPRASTHLADTSRALERMVLAHGPFNSVIAHSFGAAASCLMLSRLPEVQPERMALLAPMRDMEQHLQVFADIALLSQVRAERLRRKVTNIVGVAPLRVSAAEALRDLAMPGLIIHDRHDPVIPHDAGVALAECWRGATLLSTSRLGHRRVLKCPRVLEEVLRLHGAG